MHDLLYSHYIVPLGAFAVGIAYAGFSTWRRIRERELTHEADMRQKEMDHQRDMKEKELELARLKGVSAP
jgi:hypothetical protein